MRRPLKQIRSRYQEHNLPKIPVSDELRSSIISVLRKRIRIAGKEKGVLDIRAGDETGEIVYVALEMNVSCMVYEDDLFFHFEWQFGGDKQRARKGDFLSELSEELSG